MLARHFLQHSSRELGVEPKQLSQAALNYMAGLNWSGNVRQLENVCHWLTVMAPGQNIDVADLPPELREGNSRSLSSISWQDALGQEVTDVLNRGEKNVLETLTQQFEHILITKALEHTAGRRIEAAGLLGMGRNTMTRKIQELGIGE